MTPQETVTRLWRELRTGPVRIVDAEPLYHACRQMLGGDDRMFSCLPPRGFIVAGKPCDCCGGLLTVSALAYDRNGREARYRNSDDYDICHLCVVDGLKALARQNAERTPEAVER